MQRQNKEWTPQKVKLNTWDKLSYKTSTKLKRSLHKNFIQNWYIISTVHDRLDAEVTMLSSLSLVYSLHIYVYDNVSVQHGVSIQNLSHHEQINSGTTVQEYPQNRTRLDKFHNRSLTHKHIWTKICKMKIGAIMSSFLLLPSFLLQQTRLSIILNRRDQPHLLNNTSHGVIKRWYQGNLKRLKN